MGLLTLALHGAVIYWVSQRPVPVLPIVPPEVPPMSLGFSLPAPGSSANAAYLKTPAPDSPSLAQRRGWEGTVLLRVHVLASGMPAPTFYRSDCVFGY